jgi:hypothetical protein
MNGPFPVAWRTCTLWLNQSRPYLAVAQWGLPWQGVADEAASNCCGGFGACSTRWHQLCRTDSLLVWLAPGMLLRTGCSPVGWKIVKHNHKVTPPQTAQLRTSAASAGSASCSALL